MDFAKAVGNAVQTELQHSGSGSFLLNKILPELAGATGLDGLLDLLEQGLRVGLMLVDLDDLHNEETKADHQTD